MYYLTYRSQSLKELDHSHVRKQLEKIMTSETIPHAFLFTGPKGTGKTSAARIVAKILNAKENLTSVQTLEPKLKHETLIAIAKGTSPDVIEIDAASHRKIDDVRQLISELKFAPLISKYKIYIIDEVHMLTKEAFNALLKSLEEPPSTTIFILATTELDDLPKTITSRCVVVHFGHADKRDLIAMLKRIVKGEKLSCPEEILSCIADCADGSFRDAAKMLEMAVMQQAFSVEKLQEVLGRGWSTDELLGILDTGTLKETLTWIEDAAAKNANFRLLIESLLSLLHTILIQRNGIDVELTKTYNFSIKDVAVLIGLLQRAYQEMKYSPIQSLPLELVVIEFTDHKAKGV